MFRWLRRGDLTLGQHRMSDYAPAERRREKARACFEKAEGVFQ